MLDFIGSQPRSAQLLAFKNNKFVQSLRSLLARWTIFLVIYLFDTYVEATKIYEYLFFKVYT